MRLISLLFLLFIGLTIKAQDMIYLNNGDSIKCRISKDDGKDVYFEVDRKGKDIQTFVNKDSVKTVYYAKGDNIAYVPGKISLCVFGSRWAFPFEYKNYSSIGFSVGTFLKKEIGLDLCVNYFEHSGAIPLSCLEVGPIVTIYSWHNSRNPYFFSGVLANRLHYTRSNFGFGSPSKSFIESFNFDLNFGGGINLLFKKKVGFIGEMKVHYLLNKIRTETSTEFTNLYIEFVIGINGVFSL